MTVGRGVSVAVFWAAVVCGASDVAAALGFPLLVLAIPVRGLVVLLIQGLFQP